MCGICGIVHVDGAPVDPLLLEAMTATLVHRGPDDDGYYVSGGVGLGMRRLSIIDLPGGRQPIANEDETIRIVFNGEIYNYRELREDLVSRGHVFRTHSDTEVIVHLYEEMGAECVTRLNGMFAFAIADRRRKRLMLARDRLGIKPLFYAHEPGGRLIFGSEIKAVLAAGVDSAPDYQALFDYLSLMYVPTPSTAYAAIRKLPPASVMIFDERGLDIREYWDIPLPPAGEEQPVTDRCADEVLDLIETAIRRQMIADVPVGALLSGGLDSTTITAVMARKLDVPVKTFTVGFDRKSYDESKEARLVAKTLGTEHREERVRPEMIDSIPDLFNFFDEPFADYSAIPTYLVSRLASQHVKVVLTGDGGDEVFAGYQTHLAPRVARFYRLIPRFFRENYINPFVLRLPTSFERISFDYMAKRFVTGADFTLAAGHYWWKVIFNEEDKSYLCSKDFLSRRFENPFRVFKRHFDKASAAAPLNQLLYVDAKTFLLDDNLAKVDRMTMANSLEARVPFLDHELVERIAVMPPEVKIPGFRTKRLLRDATRNLLPPAIRRGKKKGFTPPFPFWIRNELREFVLDTLSEKRISELGIFNPSYVQTMIDEHMENKKDNNRQIWTALALVCWLNGR